MHEKRILLIFCIGILFLSGCTTNGSQTADMASIVVVGEVIDEVTFPIPKNRALEWTSIPIKVKVEQVIEPDRYNKVKVEKDDILTVEIHSATKFDCIETTIEHKVECRKLDTLTVLELTSTSQQLPDGSIMSSGRRDYCFQENRNVEFGFARHARWAGVIQSEDSGACPKDCPSSNEKCPLAADQFVTAKTINRDKQEEVRSFYAEEGIDKLQKGSKIRGVLSCLRREGKCETWDTSAGEYYNPETRQKILTILK